MSEQQSGGKSTRPQHHHNQQKEADSDSDSDIIKMEPEIKSRPRYNKVSLKIDNVNVARGRGVVYSN